ncbi:transposase [Actinomadura sp. LCR2-06]|uniref:Transposase n=1 Tax=Actinomadura violacea TaxID=2819934 RepID=A0ABS3RL59_9ACTN|nr:transposase [Actinomadura violacea]
MSRSAQKPDAAGVVLDDRQARMRRDLNPMRPADEITTEPKLLVARRADLIQDRTRTINRPRALLTGTFLRPGSHLRRRSDRRASASTYGEAAGGSEHRVAQADGGPADRTRQAVGNIPWRCDELAEVLASLGDPALDELRQRFQRTRGHVHERVQVRQGLVFGRRPDPVQEFRGRLWLYRQGCVGQTAVRVAGLRRLADSQVWAAFRQSGQQVDRPRARALGPTPFRRVGEMSEQTNADVVNQWSTKMEPTAVPHAEPAQRIRDDHRCGVAEHDGGPRRSRSR